MTIMPSADEQQKQFDGLQGRRLPMDATDVQTGPNRR